MSNRPEWLLVDFAVTLLGATLVPISTWSRARELGYVLDHCDATTLITVEGFAGQDYRGMLAELGGPASPRLPTLARVVTVGRELDALRDLGEAVDDAALDAAQRAVTPDDVAYILYTSGTTSTPKGVQLQHRGLVENMWNIGERQHLTGDDRMWMGISLFWSFGCANALLAVITHRRPIVLLEGLEPGAARAVFERGPGAGDYGTPNISLALTENPEPPRGELPGRRTRASLGPP